MPRGSLDNTPQLGFMGGDGGLAGSAGGFAGRGIVSYAEVLTGGTEAFKLNEASGDITGAIAGTVLTVAGSPTYSVTASGLFSGLSPGITYGLNIGHRKTTATTLFDLSAGLAFTLEMFFNKTTAAGTQYLTSFNGHASNTDYGLLLYGNGDTTIGMDMQADDGTTSASSWTVPAMTDGNIHKIRVGATLGGNAELWFDGVSKGTQSLAGQAGKVFTNQGIRICDQYNNGGANLRGTMFFWKYTSGSATANMGGPNGG